MEMHFPWSNETLHILAAVVVIILIDWITTRSFEPLWGVMRVATERLANAHHLVVGKLHELAKEVKEYGDKQKDKHKAVSHVNSSINYCISLYLYL